MTTKLPGSRIATGAITSEKIASGAVTAEKVAAGAVAAGGPKITNIEVTDSSYTVLDDTAVDTAGGYIKITGTGFEAGCSVIVGTTTATSTTFVSATEVRAQVPAQSAGTYLVYLVNTDGGVAVRVNGLTYSASPVWVTASALANATSNVAYTYTLSATGATTYSLQAGSSLPSGATLTSGGTLSGTTVVANATAYSFTVVASDAQNQDSPRTFNLNVNLVAPPGQQEFTTVGTTSWTVPDGVTTISAVLVGGGGGAGSGAAAGGGGLRYINDLPVTSGETLTIVVGSGGATVTAGGNSSIKRSSNILVEAYGGGAGNNGTSNTYGLGGTGIAVGAGPYGGTVGGGNGGNGGATDDTNFGPGGGGAGGYAGQGGWGGSAGGIGSGQPSGTSGTGGAGGGAGLSRGYGGYQVGGGGGGVGLLGQGSNGTGGAYTGAQGEAGGGGSGGANGNGTGTGLGGNYGGGGGANDGVGGQGAVRIIWGPGRSFPSTNTGDV